MRPPPPDGTVSRAMSLIICFRFAATAENLLRKRGATSLTGAPQVNVGGARRGTTLRDSVARGA